MASAVYVAMQVVLNFVESRLVNWHVSQQAIELWEQAPDQDLLEVFTEHDVLAFVVVTQDQALAATQPLDVLMTSSEVDVTQVVDDVLVLDRLVPVLHDQFVHLLERREVTYATAVLVQEVQDVLVTEVSVTDYKDVSHIKNSVLV